MKRLSVFLVVLVATACAAPPPVAPSEGPLRFSGTISAMDGQRVGGPIGNAQLTVVDGVNTNASVTTDGEGRYVFEGLDSGRFTVNIQAPGFLTANPVVDLYRDIEVNFALTPQ